MSSVATETAVRPSGRVLKSLLRPRRVTPRLAGGHGIVAATPGAASGGHFVDGGGLVLTNVHVWLIFWGTAWVDGNSPTSAEVTQAARTILQGSYMRGLNQYRGVGAGRLDGAVRVADSDPPNPFSDADVADMIYRQLERGAMPEPDDDLQILYCVIMPPGVNPAQAKVIGEHSYFVYFDLTDLNLPLDFDIGNAHYAWVANQGTLDSITTILSHELVESCTDPNGDAIKGAPGTCSQDGWCEVGDVCEAWSEVREGVRVQAYWSEKDGACILPEAAPAGAVSSGSDVAAVATPAPPPPGIWARTRARYIGGLIASSWLVPIVATVVAVIEYVAPTSIPTWAQLLPDSPALAGLVVGLASWLVLAVFLSAMASAQTANGGIYGELRERFSKLNAHLAAAAPERATEPYMEASQHRDFISAELDSAGPRWVLATGYINLWRRIHRAEEAMIEIKPEQEVIEDAQHDQLRMTDSTIAHSDDLMAKLADAGKYLAAKIAGVPPPTGCTVQSSAEARGIVRSMRYTVDDFRDQRWAGLVHARNLLIGTTLLTEAFAFILLALAVVEKAPTNAIVAGIVFFQVGAVVGLFNRLSQTAAAGTMVEDYSLGAVRTILTPIVSGLAAIGGVVLTGMVTMSGLTGLVQPGASGGTSTPLALPALSDIFDLNKFRIGLLLAALFGWAPSLLISRLQQLTDQYKEDLKSTEPSVSAQGATPKRGQ